MFPITGFRDSYDLVKARQERYQEEAARRRLAEIARDARHAERDEARRAMHIHQHVTWEILRHEFRAHLLHAHAPRRHAFAAALHAVPTHRVRSR